MAYALTGNDHDAWDLVQESLVRVGTRWRRLRDENPGGYARTVLVRLNVDRLRRLRRDRLTGRLPERAAPDTTVDPAAEAQLEQQMTEAAGVRVQLEEWTGKIEWVSSDYYGYGR